jgi:hypothetical protein
MAYNNGPRIITDGLVLCLDAGNSKSYPGSGSTWKNLASSNFNATMFGTVPYEIDTVPCWNFATATGASSPASSLGFSFAANMIQRTGDFTFSCWIKNPNSSSGQVGLFSNTSSGDGYRFGVGLNGIYFLIGPSYTEGSISFVSSLSSNLWYNVVAIYNRTAAQMLLYLNGIYQTNRSIPASQTTMQNGSPGIVRSSCCGIYTGKLACFSAYNKSLTILEIQQNYNALKGRFGL